MRGSDAQHFDPVVYFENADGHRLFPGRATEQPPSGYQRRELNTVASVRAFEKSENKRLREEHHDSQMREQINYDYHRKRVIDQIRHDLPSMTGVQRQAAESLLARADGRSFSRKAAKFEPNFYIECFSKDASNRSEWSDRDTVGRRGRR